MGLKDKLAPFGILNMMTGLFTVIFGVSFETSDFIVDCLEQWWDDNKKPVWTHQTVKLSTWTTAHKTLATGRNL